MLRKNKSFHYNPRYSDEYTNSLQKKKKRGNNFLLIISLIILFLLAYIITSYPY